MTNSSVGSGSLNTAQYAVFAHQVDPATGDIQHTLLGYVPTEATIPRLRAYLQEFGISLALPGTVVDANPRGRPGREVLVRDADYGSSRPMRFPSTVAAAKEMGVTQAAVCCALRRAEMARGWATVKGRWQVRGAAEDFAETLSNVSE